MNMLGNKNWFLLAASLFILLPIGGGNEAFDDATGVCSCADGATHLYGNSAAASLPCCLPRLSLWFGELHG
jgi:hypothetical protein